MENLLPQQTGMHGGKVFKDGSVLNHATGEVLKIGDFVETYHKGLWRITGFSPGSAWFEEVKPGFNGHILVKYEKVLGEDWGAPKGVKNKSCDLAYISKITTQKIAKEAAARTQKLIEIGVPEE